MTDLQTQIEELDAEIAIERGAADRAMTVVKKLADKRDKLIDKFLEEKYPTITKKLSRKEYRELCSYSFNNMTAHKKLEELYSLFGLDSFGIVYRGKQFESEYYVTPNVRVSHKMAQKDLRTLTDNIRALCNIIDNNPVYLDLMTNDLSASGVVAIDYDADTDEATLHKTVYHRRSDLMTDSLLAVLQHCSTNYYYGDDDSEDA